MEKETAKEISTGRKLLFTAIIFFMFLLLIEGLLSIYYYQKKGVEKAASIEAIKTIKKKLAPESKELVYDPWLEYGNKNINSSYGGTSVDTLDIYFFGGSSMQAIPSQFVELYKNKFPQAAPLRVFNYGTSNYYSYQELMLLTNLIQKGHHPDILVFLDGINDFRFGNVSYYNQSYFSYIFRQFFDSGLRSSGEFKFIDTANAIFKTPDYLKPEEFNKTLITNYISNIRNIKMLADIIDARAYFFCQPSPFYNYTGQSQDPAISEINTRFNYIYPALEKMQDSLPGFTYLGNIPVQQVDNPFVDREYSPQFINKIAEQILLKIEKDL